jgi:hypothetical protein
VVRVAGVACIERPSIDCARPKFQQLPMDAGRAPQRVRHSHLANRRTSARRSSWTAATMTTPPPPEQPEAASMPCEHGCRCDQDERRSPSAAVTRRRVRRDRFTTAS